MRITFYLNEGLPLFRKLVMAMSENKPTKQINNSVCAMNGCNKPVKESLVFALGFSAGFCEHCANSLMVQGLTIRVTEIST